METKDARALIRFKRSGRLYLVSKNVVDRNMESKNESAHLSEVDKCR